MFTHEIPGLLQTVTDSGLLQDFNISEITSTETFRTIVTELIAGSSGMAYFLTRRRIRSLYERFLYPVFTSKPYLPRADFLKEVRNYIDINNIYYPGCDWDRSLEKAFKPDEIFYLDTKPPNYKNAVLADMGNAPFPDHTFDAAFMQDVHASQAQYDDIVRVIKPYGILIFSTDDCYWVSGIRPRHIKKDPRFEKAELPFVNHYYSVYQRVGFDYNFRMFDPSNI